MNNKIIDIQEMLFKEMKRLDDDKMLDFTNNKATQNEFARATALYNMSTGFIKSLNANLSIMNLAKREQTKYDELLKQLGLSDDNKD